MTAPLALHIETACAKLHWLEEQASLLQRQPPKPGQQRIRELTLQSLRKLINRLKEELMRYDADRETGR